MVDEVRSEIDISNLDVFLVHEFFEMVADKFARFRMRHSGSSVDRFQAVSL
jgi:hypothetical protein